MVLSTRADPRSPVCSLFQAPSVYQTRIRKLFFPRDAEFARSEGKKIKTRNSPILFFFAFVKVTLCVVYRVLRIVCCVSSAVYRVLRIVCCVSCVVHRALCIVTTRSHVLQLFDSEDVQCLKYLEKQTYK